MLKTPDEELLSPAAAGLIITEATNISRQGTGYSLTPGIVDDYRNAAHGYTDFKTLEEHERQ